MLTIQICMPMRSHKVLLLSEKVSTVQDILRENIYIMFIKIHCYNCMILLLVILNFLLYLMYKLKFMMIDRKKDR